MTEDEDVYEYNRAVKSALEERIAEMALIKAQSGDRSFVVKQRPRGEYKYKMKDAAELKVEQEKPEGYGKWA